MESSRTSLPSVVLPGVRINALLGMLWIDNADVSMDTVTLTIRHKGREYTYKKLSIPSSPAEVLIATLYADKACKISPLDS